MGILIRIAGWTTIHSLLTLLHQRTAGALLHDITKQHPKDHYPALGQSATPSLALVNVPVRARSFSNIVGEFPLVESLTPLVHFYRVSIG